MPSLSCIVFSFCDCLLGWWQVTGGGTGLKWMQLDRQMFLHSHGHNGEVPCCLLLSYGKINEGRHQRKAREGDEGKEQWGQRPNLLLRCQRAGQWHPQPSVWVPSISCAIWKRLMLLACPSDLRTRPQSWVYNVRAVVSGSSCRVLPV
jgi:hypothetical protein